MKKLEEKKLSRRSFCFKMGKEIGITAIGVSALPSLGNVSTHAENTRDGCIDNLTLQMYKDMQRALSKPLEKRKWGMVIDVKKCIGCEACIVACIAENNLPPGVTYRTIKEIGTGSYPNLKRYFIPTNCMHCDNPACMEAANKIVPGAITKRPDGIVQLNFEKFAGKKVFEAAQKACPYTALYFDEGKNYTDGTPALQKYEKRRTTEYGKNISRISMRNIGRKCHFCLHRIEAGILPACVTTCTGHAMHFGDLNDPESLVSLCKEAKTFRLKDVKNKPNIVYLNGQDDPKETCAICHP